MGLRNIIAKKVSQHQNQIGKRNRGKADKQKYIGGRLVIGILLFVVVGSAVLQLYQALIGKADAF